MVDNSGADMAPSTATRRGSGPGEVWWTSPEPVDGPFNYFDPNRPSLYRDATPRLPATYTREAFEALPEFLRKSLNGEKSGQWPANPEKKFLDDVRICYHLVSGVDVAVGQVMETLRRLKRDQNTVVIFTSDNGSMRGAHGLWGKWIPYEESIRVPLIIRDPRAANSSRGSVRDQMTLNIDMVPTILGLAGLAPAAGMQGRDLAPVLRNAKATGRDEWFYEHTYPAGPNQLPIAPSEAVRTSRWKYVRYIGESPVFEQLFDLKTDPMELHNLVGVKAHQKTLVGLRARHAVLKAQAA